MASADHDPRPTHGAIPTAQFRPDRGGGGQEAALPAVVEFRRRTLLPLGRRFQAACARRYPSSAAVPCAAAWCDTASPACRGARKAAKCQRFAETAIGFVHTDVCELRLAQGKLFM